MILLDLCGGTGSWSEPYKDAGWDVKVVTLPKYDVTRWREYPEIVELVLSGNVTGVLAAPPCTKFSRAAWQIPRKERDFVEGMRCVRACLDIIWTVQEHSGADLKFWALENPDGYLVRFLGYTKFYFQPWQYGETDFRATKRTMLWGYFKMPSRSVRKRTIPFISPHSRHDGKGSCVKQRRNEGWGKMSAVERAKTSGYFAEAFFQANH